MHTRTHDAREEHDLIQNPTVHLHLHRDLYQAPVQNSGKIWCNFVVTFAPGILSRVARATHMPRSGHLMGHLILALEIVLV